MTLFKQAVNNIKKDVGVHIITVLQLTAVIVIAAIMVSSLLVGYKYYDPFEDILQSKGIYCRFPFRASTSTDFLVNPETTIPDDEIKKYIPEIENVISCNMGFSNIAEVNGNPVGNVSDYSILYDDEIIKRYKPEIAEGRWLNTSENAQYIEAVVSENDYGIKVGDKLKMSCLVDDVGTFEYLEALVVGMVPENAKIVGYNHSYVGDISINNFYGTVNFDIEQEVVVMMSSNYLSNTPKFYQGIFGPALITVSEDCSDERLGEIRQGLSNYNCDASYLLSEVNENSLSNIFRHLKDLLPIIAVLLIMIVVSGISSSALSTRREIKSFAIFYITGLQWKQCGFIGLIGSSILALFSVILSAAAILVLKSTAFGVQINILFQWQTVVCIAAIIAFFILISMIMPLIMLSRTTPKQILTR